MFAFDPSQKHMGPIQVQTSGQAPAATATRTADASDGEDFFHRLLDVVNPLQHLPVVGTLYRAATGEHIGPLEKIAGDALYGGLWGAATSIADVAFEQITGKSVEDTMLAWLKPDETTKLAPRAIAANTALPTADMPALPQAAAANVPDIKVPDSRELLALTSALNLRGVDGDTAARALYAYRRTASPVPVMASLN